MVGSGPAGLTAAWQLARKGYRVKIFEAAPEPGGMLRLAIPGYRLPVAVVEQDIAERDRAGRGDRHQHACRGTLKSCGARGTTRSWWRPARRSRPASACRARTWTASSPAWSSSRRPSAARRPACEGKRIVIVGGGNVAMDAARTARRLGAAAEPGELDEIVVTDAARTAWRLGAPM